MTISVSALVKGSPKTDGPIQNHHTWHHCSTMHVPIMQVLWWLRTDWQISNSLVHSLWLIISEKHLFIYSLTPIPYQLRISPRSIIPPTLLECACKQSSKLPWCQGRPSDSRGEMQVLRREAVSMPRTVWSCMYAQVSEGDTGWGMKIICHKWEIHQGSCYITENKGLDKSFWSISKIKKLNRSYIVIQQKKIKEYCMQKKQIKD